MRVGLTVNFLVCGNFSPKFGAKGCKLYFLPFREKNLKNGLIMFLICTAARTGLQEMLGSPEQQNLNSFFSRSGLNIVGLIGALRH